ncbi:hypothetical protein BDZ97DRAFT_1761533 [Flammula alnicola]|nr:hypothetical protein BDZ97DRAFT_1761533 [Flammula alnicola]
MMTYPRESGVRSHRERVDVSVADLQSPSMSNEKPGGAWVGRRVHLKGKTGSRKYESPRSIIFVFQSNPQSLEKPSSSRNLYYVGSHTGILAESYKERRAGHRRWPGSEVFPFAPPEPWYLPRAILWGLLHMYPIPVSSRIIGSSAKQVRFNPNDEYFVYDDGISHSPSPILSIPSLTSNSTISSEGVPTPPPSSIHQSSLFREAYGGHAFYADPPRQEDNGAPHMSHSLLAVQEIPWDVHTARTPTQFDGDYATTDRSIRQIILKSDKLLEDILVTPAAGQHYITVAQVYETISHALAKQVDVNSTFFSAQSAEMRKAVWESCRRRVKRPDFGIRLVQQVDFLLDHHTMLGISLGGGSKHWVIHFGPRLDNSPVGLR